METQHSGELRAEVTCSKDGNVINYHIKIIGDKRLGVIENNERNTPMEISMDGAICLEAAKSLYCDLKLQPIEIDNIYTEPIKVCVSCRNYYDSGGEICVYGHIICAACKNNSCAACEKVVAVQTRVSCANTGCNWMGSSLNSRQHEDECLYAELFCPYQSCTWKSPEKDLQLHAIVTHNVQTSECVVKQLLYEDDLWLMDFAGRLFVCKCYAYEEGVEFVVELCSNNPVAKEFSFVVEIVCDDGRVLFKKHRACLLYRKSVLEPGVVITHKEIGVSLSKNISYRVLIKST